MAPPLPMNCQRGELSSGVEVQEAATVTVLAWTLAGVYHVAKAETQKFGDGK